ncbi:thiol-disulfide isomerase/thioredoxin [Paenibacillus shirakamiensis]|uniref:Thiol-disulfide isomerase/thioredoxin n=1 Tax=Paenibacillus shirakamiensis TaxID=1265935 RepID=A0ABS4JIL3_9BACL|nr:thioredoxin family protein [Paenibacillus shirakamiensis]MBP2001538.1 thiol-disulfide isomerase/thioredoxin [Paenibacillus shirakamiensis]
MPLHELQEQELLHYLTHSTGKMALLIHTTFCGTCQLAERMLDIVNIALPELELYKLNINYAPHLRDTWQITSVPCLVIFEDGNPLNFEYAMHSVDYLYQLLKPNQS